VNVCIGPQNDLEGHSRSSEMARFHRIKAKKFSTCAVKVMRLDKYSGEEMIVRLGFDEDTVSVL